MSRFEFVTMLMSFVVAFGISEVLAGWGQQLRNRDRVKAHPLQLFASLLILLALLQSLWGYWNFRDVEWTFVGFLVALAPLLILSATTFLVTPAIPLRGGVDVRAHYQRTCRAMFLMIALFIVAGAVAERLLTGPTLHAGDAIRAAALLVLGGAATTRDERIHWVALGTLGLLQLAFAEVVTPVLA